MDEKTTLLSEMLDECMRSGPDAATTDVLLRGIKRIEELERAVVSARDQCRNHERERLQAELDKIRDAERARCLRHALDETKDHHQVAMAIGSGEE